METKQERKSKLWYIADISDEQLKQFSKILKLSQISFTTEKKAERLFQITFSTEESYSYLKTVLPRDFPDTVIILPESIVVKVEITLDPHWLNFLKHGDEGVQEIIGEYNRELLEWKSGLVMHEESLTSAHSTLSALSKIQEVALEKFVLKNKWNSAPAHFLNESTSHKSKVNDDDQNIYTSSADDDDSINQISNDSSKTQQNSSNSCAQPKRNRVLVSPNISKTKSKSLIHNNHKADVEDNINIRSFRPSSPDNFSGQLKTSFSQDGRCRSKSTDSTQRMKVQHKLIRHNDDEINDIRNISISNADNDYYDRINQINSGFSKLSLQSSSNSSDKVKCKRELVNPNVTGITSNPYLQMNRKPDVDDCVRLRSFRSLSPDDSAWKSKVSSQARRYRSSSMDNNRRINQSLISPHLKATSSSREDLPGVQWIQLSSCQKEFTTPVTQIKVFKSDSSDQSKRNRVLLTQDNTSTRTQSFVQSKHKPDADDNVSIRSFRSSSPDDSVGQSKVPSKARVRRSNLIDTGKRSMLLSSGVREFTTPITQIKVEILQGNITDQFVDVIVNPANEHLVHLAGAAKAIAQAAGRELEKESKEYIQKYKRLEVATPIHTTAGNLRPAIRYVIHIVGPRLTSSSTIDACRKILIVAFIKCLEYANKELKVKSIAIPAISSGKFGMPNDVVASSAFEAVKKYDKFMGSNRQRYLKVVRFVNIDKESTQAFQAECLKMSNSGSLSVHSSSANSSKAPRKTLSAKSDCAICVDYITDPKTLRCGHVFCSSCIDQAFAIKKKCPLCGSLYEPMTGNQPDGDMIINQSYMDIPGYPGDGSIEIIYRIPSGTQTSEHPNPGMLYPGTTRKAYLPNNAEGQEICELLKKAFAAKLIFTVGKSARSGKDNCVTWNDIDHKTSYTGSYGYPDPTYLSRVKCELAAKGITNDPAPDPVARPPSPLNRDPSPDEISRPIVRGPAERGSFSANKPKSPRGGRESPSNVASARDPIESNSARSRKGSTQWYDEPSQSSAAAATSERSRKDSTQWYVDPHLPSSTAAAAAAAVGGSPSIRYDKTISNGTLRYKVDPADSYWNESSRRHHTLNSHGSANQYHSLDPYITTNNYRAGDYASSNSHSNPPATNSRDIAVSSGDKLFTGGRSNSFYGTTSTALSNPAINRTRSSSVRSSYKNNEYRTHNSRYGDSTNF